MRNTHPPFIRTAVSLALALALPPAIAQEQAVEEEQELVADTNNNDAVEVIEVKGVRASMMQAQDIKMNSDSILDAIVAEDIGKLPDNTVAESIARVAGVQVTRNGDEANGIIIRGVPDVTTTYNGREIFTAELRRVQLQDFPSQAIAGVEVYKSGTADIMEPGLGGLVNVRTRRPLDFEGQVVAGGFHYTYNDQNGAKDPSGNILFSDRWDSDFGEMGFLFNATYAQAQWHHGNRYNNTDFWIAPDWWTINDEEYADGGFVVPTGVGVYNTGGKRYRPSANFSFQWRPNEDTEYYVEGIYQGYRGESFVDQVHFNLVDWDGKYGIGNQPVIDNLVVNDNRGASSFTKSGGMPTEGKREAQKDSTDTFQIAVGGVWNLERMTIEADLAYTDSEYKRDLYSFEWFVPGATVDVDFDKDQGVAFDVTDVDMADPANYLWRGHWEQKWNPKGDGVQFRTDLTYDTGNSFLHTLQAGVRLNHRTAAYDYGDRFADLKDLRIPVNDTAAGGFLNLSQNSFRSNAQGFTQWLVPGEGWLLDNHDALRQQALAGIEQTLEWWPDWQVEARERFLTEDVQYLPNSYFEAEEDSYAAYLQGKYSFFHNDWEFDGIVGLRVVQTIATTRGTSVITFEGEQEITPREIENDYVDVLPNVSIKARKDDYQIRAGFTKTRTRVNFGDLNPALNITQVGSNFGPEQPAPPFDGDGQRQPDAYGTTGNPDLDPLTADNFDLSFEWYFSETGYASFATFYKEIEGWTNRYTRRVEDPVYGYLEINRPENSGEGKLRGYEMNFQTFLNYDFIPEDLHYLGISANATHLNGEERKPDGEGSFGGYEDMLGLSDWTYNAAIFYERDGFGTRLSYNYRSEWTNWINSFEGDGRSNHTKSRDRLDFSIWYDFNENFTVYLDISNILANPFINYTKVPADHQGADLPGDLRYTQDVRDEGRYYGAGFRFRF